MPGRARNWLSFAVCSLTWVALAGAQQPESDADLEIRKGLEKITQVYHLAMTQLADPPDPEEAVYQGAIPGALSRLDPFSVFLDADQFLSLQQQARGVQQGFGAILSVQAGQVTVLHSVPGAPFARAGLGPGDRIVRINGQAVASLDLQELVGLLQKAKSGPVRLSVIQSGKLVPQPFELDPTEVPSPTVDKKFLLEPTVGYLHVSRIEQGTAQEIRAAIEQWRSPASSSAALEGLILDFRDNPGGSLEGAVETAGLFLPPGKTVVSLRGRAVPERSYVVESLTPYPDLPVVVIINGRTASAAEIIAAALQDLDRAWLVGEASFGKGVAESVLPLSEGSALVLTTALHFTPQGRSVQRPLPGTALADIVKRRTQKRFTDRGRPLAGDGGVEPDEQAPTWQLDPWAEYVGQSTAFLNFAQSFIERHGKVEDSVEVNESVLEDFRRYLLEAGAPVPDPSWERSLPYLKARIKTELVTLALGIARGDEVEVRADPQVQGARKAIPQAQQLLRKAEPAGGSPQEENVR